jgi:hypothetical protein
MPTLQQDKNFMLSIEYVRKWVERRGGLPPGPPKEDDPRFAAKRVRRRYDIRSPAWDFRAEISKGYNDNIWVSDWYTTTEPAEAVAWCTEQFRVHPKARIWMSCRDRTGQYSFSKAKLPSLKNMDELFQILPPLPPDKNDPRFARRVAVLIQKHNKNTDRTEWALVSKKDHSKVLRWYGRTKPDAAAVLKDEKRVQYFKHRG